MHKLSFSLETDKKYSPNKLSYSISSTALKRTRHKKKKKKSSKSAAPTQEVKVLVQIGKEVMFYRWHCNYGRLISVCRTRSSHWWRTHRAWKERDLCVRSSSTWQKSLWPLADAAQAAQAWALPALAVFHPPPWLESAQLSTKRKKKKKNQRQKTKPKPTATVFERGGCAHGQNK